MLMRMCGALGCALLLTIPSFAADPQAELGRNAALKYWRAFSLLPADDHFKKVMDTDITEIDPLDPEVDKLLTQHKAMLDIMHWAARIDACDWSVDYDAGPAALLPHLQKCRRLAHIVCLRARQRLAKGEINGAIDDFADAMRLSRHAGTDATLIAVLVQFAIEATVQSAICADLLKFDAAARQKLRTRLGQLPPGGTIRNSILREKDFFAQWMGDQVKAGKKDFPDFKEIEEVLKQGGNKEEALKQLAEMRGHYDEIAAFTELPSREVPAKMAELAKRVKDNHFSSKLLPAIDKVMIANDRTKAREALFQAALAVADGGTNALENHADPFGDGPFTYRKTDGGFELSSKFKYKDVPVMLVVGPKKK